jgi:hypothetical protein
MLIDVDEETSSTAKDVGGTGRVEFWKLGFLWQLEDRKVME